MSDNYKSMAQKIEELQKLIDLANDAELFSVAEYAQEILNALIPPKEERDLVNVVHTIFCSERHDVVDGCKYYGEEDLATAWNLPAHQHWLEIAKELKDATSMSYEEFTSNLIDLYQLIHLFRDQKNLMRKFLTLVQQVSGPDRFESTSMSLP